MQISDQRNRPAVRGGNVRHGDAGMNRLYRVARWLLAVPLAVATGGLVWLVVAATLDALGVEPPAWGFYLVMAYGYLAVGFVGAGIGTRCAPARRVTVSLVMVGAALGGALMLATGGAYGTAAGLVFGLSLFAGAVGHALRQRGFSVSSLTDA